MNELEIEQIWEKQKGFDFNGRKVSLEEIQNFRTSYPSRVRTAKHRVLLFDSIYKALVIATAWIIFLLIGEITLLNLSLTLLISIGLTVLITRNIQLKRIFESIDLSGDLISVLKEQYRFLHRFYNEFVISSAVTNPFFVLAGFQLYHFIKYRQDNLAFILTDPVTYIFLILAFAIPFVTQRKTYGTELEELENIINIEVEEVSQEVTLVRIYEKRKSRFILFLLLIVTGILLLLITLNVFL